MSCLSPFRGFQATFAIGAEGGGVKALHAVQRLKKKLTSHKDAHIQTDSGSDAEEELDVCAEDQYVVTAHTLNMATV